MSSEKDKNDPDIPDEIDLDMLDEDAIQLGYEDCLDRDSLHHWTGEASLDALYRFLSSLSNFQSVFLIDDSDALQEVLLDDDSPHAQFVEHAKIEKRLDNIEDFSSPDSVIRIRVDLLLPEFDDMVDIVREAITDSPESPWEKAHVSLISQWPRPIGPCELDAVTYASRHGDDEVSTEDVRDILLGLTQLASSFRSFTSTSLCEADSSSGDESSKSRRPRLYPLSGCGAEGVHLY